MLVVAVSLVRLRTHGLLLGDRWVLVVVRTDSSVLRLPAFVLRVFGSRLRSVFVLVSGV